MHIFQYSKIPSLLRWALCRILFDLSYYAFGLDSALENFVNFLEDFQKKRTHCVWFHRLSSSSFHARGLCFVVPALKRFCFWICVDHIGDCNFCLLVCFRFNSINIVIKLEIDQTWRVVIKQFVKEMWVWKD